VEDEFTSQPWVDGNLNCMDGMVTSYLGKGFPSVGTWTYDKFQPGGKAWGVTWDYEQGKGVPIEGGDPCRASNGGVHPSSNINAIWLYRYMSQAETSESLVWWDHLVIAKKYIGPITPGQRVSLAPLG